MLELDGSSSTWRTPRGEQTARLLYSSRDPVHDAGSGAPLCRNAQVRPPSVDLYRPHLAAPGTGRVTPPQQVLDMPRSAVVVPTYSVRGSPGLITIWPMPLPPSSALPSGPCQVMPPLV